MINNLSDKSFLLPEKKAKAVSAEHNRRWKLLCETYLPVSSENSIWRYNRIAREDEPSQGWKLHISATVLDACEVFEKIAPFLNSENIQFKAPNSLNELSEINSGLQYGYWQVGKFVTVYPSTERQSVLLAEKLHRLTGEYFAIKVPFDNQYLPDSSIFYRYGAFQHIEIKDEKGTVASAIRDSAGKLVIDNRFRAVPEWLFDPFQEVGNISPTESAESPFPKTYQIFRAITQRGKGGTYQAIDLSVEPPRLCVIKEGRKFGELSWNNQDGYNLVKNEFHILSKLRKSYPNAPQIFNSFESDGNFYIVMENIYGKSLHSLMRFRRRRFSLKQILKFAIEIAELLQELHESGWVWNDCKPANLLVTPDGKIRAIDFENAYRINKKAVFQWSTAVFSTPSQLASNGIKDDFYAFGAVLYFLLTGKFYDPEKPTAISKLRRNVPKKLCEITQYMLENGCSELFKAVEEFKSISKDL